MKNIKTFLDFEKSEAINIGLIRTSREIVPHELFFHINKNNEYLSFRREKDLKKEGNFHIYSHLCFKTYHKNLKCFAQIFSNKSIKAALKSIQGDLFSTEIGINYLLPQHRDVDYILQTTDNISDFSVFLRLEKFLFPIQNFTLSPDEELYNIIQYYE